MSYNPHSFYWSQFSFRATPESYSDRSREARSLRDEEPHDARTRRLIEQYDEVYKLAEADTVVPLIDRWYWLERMAGAEEKQNMLEPLIQQVQRSPKEHQGQLLFLLLVLEPLRRTVARRLLAGVNLGSRGSGETDRHRRDEARWLHEIERETLFDHTRHAMLEVIHGYSFKVAPGRFFAWFKETLSYRVVDLYKKEYLGPNSGLPPAQVAAIQHLLHGFEEFDAPDLRDSPGLPGWRALVGPVRPLFSLVDRYTDVPQVRKICQDALGRLGRRQRETLEDYYYEDLTLAQIAERRRVALSTVGNLKAQAESRLRGDDIFYVVLDAIGMVRIQSRRREIEERYPDGVLPDGTRIVFIGG